MTIEYKENFITQIIESDLTSNKHKKIITRFPPEPNGYLHIGHAKSICLNFGLAQVFNGECYLRYDDTNPLKEEDEFVQAIAQDVQWLGFTWKAITYSSDYYDALYNFALLLIDKGLAYVDSLSMEEIRQYRGTLTQPGTESPYRNRSIDENKQLFLQMKEGKFAESSHVLRAKIDMSSGNINMRDPVLYRIRYAKHQRTGDIWCIYPMYDYAHPISDALEHITHSLCTLEFQDHRPLYDWFIDNLPVPAKPRQIEFSRLNLSHTVTSKRKLKILVDEKIVDGWDDPRLPTIKGMRKRGYSPRAIKNFCEIVGISKSDSVIDMSILEACVRDDLNAHAKRAMCVLNPLKLVIENFDMDLLELEVPYIANGPTRKLPFSKELFIERDDFMEVPTKNYFRLYNGGEVRLRHAYIFKCTSVIKDTNGEIVEIRGNIDKSTLGANPTDRKVKGVIHWVCAKNAALMQIIKYDRLFTIANPNGDDFLEHINPNSKIISTGFVEPALLNAQYEEVFQFERLGYYVVHEQNNSFVKSFSSIVSLRSSL